MLKSSCSMFGVSIKIKCLNAWGFRNRAFECSRRVAQCLGWERQVFNAWASRSMFGDDKIEFLIRGGL